MAEEPTSQETGLPEDRFVVRVFTIADYAEAVASNGKLYISGAGITVVWTEVMPGTIPSLSVALRLSVPWQHTTEPFNVKIRALNADRSPVQRDPLFEINPEVGRPPGLRPGDEISVNGAFGIGGLPVQDYGTIYFHLEVDGATVAVLTLKVAPLESAPGRLRR